MRIVLITLYDSYGQGARSIHASLAAEGFDAHLVFFKNKFPYDPRAPSEREYSLLTEHICRLGPDIVGVSLLSSALAGIAEELTRRLQRSDSPPLVIWGGHHAQVCAEQSLETVNYVCVSEGERFMCHAARRVQQGRSIEDLAGLWSRKGDTIRRRPPDPPLADLDRLALPRFGDDTLVSIDRDRLIPGDPLREETSYFTLAGRGCPFRCTFCAPVLDDPAHQQSRPVRRRSVRRFIEELTLLRSAFPQITLIGICDDVFGLDPKWLGEFVARYNEEVAIPFWCYQHPGTFSEEHARHLSRTCISHVVIGLQSGSQRVRREVFNRRESDATILAAVQRCHRYRIPIRMDLITSVPYETRRDRTDALSFILQLPPPIRFRFFPLMYTPKTRLTQRALADGLIAEEDMYGGANFRVVDRRHFQPWLPPSKRDRHWRALVSLVGQRAVPRRAIRALHKAPLLEAHPLALIALARMCSMTSLFADVARRLARNEVALHDLWASRRAVWRYII